MTTERMAQILAWRLRFALAKLVRLRRPRRRNRGRVLCVLTGGLGDKLMALPALRHLRAEFSTAELVVVIIGAAPPFLDGEADEVVSLATPDTMGLFRLARRGFDTCFINSVGAFEVRLEVAAFLTGARDTRGPWFSNVPLGKASYTRPYVFGEGHETVVNLRGAGGSAAGECVAYPLAIPDSAAAENGIPDVIFHPGSSAAGLTNRWPAESYAALARELSARGYSVAAVGAPSETALLESLRRLAPDAVEVKTSLSLEGLARLLSRARLVVANDSGIGHLAAAVGAPLITIMGANRPEKVAPVGERVSIVGPRCELGGCYNNPAVGECRMCINRIAPEEILQLAVEKLSP